MPVPPEPASDAPSTASNITGTPGDDVLVGTPGDDSLFGQDGNDSLFGEDGNDYVDGVNGDDTLRGGNGDDEIHGRNGNDLILGGPGNDVITGDRGNDVINGEDGDDVIDGNLDDDTIEGGAGNDRINAIGGGFDRVSCGDGQDVVFADVTDEVNAELRGRAAVGRSSAAALAPGARRRTSVLPLLRGKTDVRRERAGPSATGRTRRRRVELEASGASTARGRRSARTPRPCVLQPPCGCFARRGRRRRARLVRGGATSAACDCAAVGAAGGPGACSEPRALVPARAMVAIAAAPVACSATMPITIWPGRTRARRARSGRDERGQRGLVGQRRARAVQQRLDRGHRRRLAARELLVAAALELAPDQRGALRAGQPLDRAQRAGEALALLDDLEGRRRAAGQLGRQRGGRPRGAEVVVAAIAHDREQPRLDVDGHLARDDRAVRAHEAVLHGVLGQAASRPQRDVA